MKRECVAYIFAKIDEYWATLRSSVRRSKKWNSFPCDINSWMQKLITDEFDPMKPMLISGTKAYNVVYLAHIVFRRPIP